MADGVRMALAELLRKAEADPGVDVLREGVKVLAEALMELEVEQHVGARRYERSPERSGQRNGYRDRQWDTRVGSVDLHVPRVRDGSDFPALLEPRTRAERALVAVVQEASSRGSRRGGSTTWSRRSGSMASARARSAASVPRWTERSNASAAGRCARRTRISGWMRPSSRCGRRDAW